MSGFCFCSFPALKIYAWQTKLYTKARGSSRNTILKSIQSEKKKSYTDKKERIKRLEKIDRKEGKAEKAGQIRKFYYAFSLSNTSQRKQYFSKCIFFTSKIYDIF